MSAESEIFYNALDHTPSDELSKKAPPKKAPAEEEEEDFYEPPIKVQEYVDESERERRCNIHLEELAKPNKLGVRCVYANYKPLLPHRNRLVIAEFLHEEFAKTAEETADLFARKIEKRKISKCKKKCQKAARKQQKAQTNLQKRKCMLKILLMLLKKYMTKAYFNPKQIIMTNRLRGISNQVLEQLCEIRGINIPDRDGESIRTSLMYSLSDFFAFCIDSVYYDLEIMKVQEYDALKRKERRPTLASNTPISVNVEDPIT